MISMKKKNYGIAVFFNSLLAKRKSLCLLDRVASFSLSIDPMPRGKDFYFHAPIDREAKINSGVKREEEEGFFGLAFWPRKK